MLTCKSLDLGIGRKNTLNCRSWFPTESLHRQTAQPTRGVVSPDSAAASQPPASQWNLALPASHATCAATCADVLTPYLALRPSIWQCRPHRWLQPPVHMTDTCTDVSASRDGIYHSTQVDCLYSKQSRRVVALQRVHMTRSPAAPAGTTPMSSASSSWQRSRPAAKYQGRAAGAGRILGLYRCARALHAPVNAARAMSIQAAILAAPS
jgi:hypothetical protein